MEAKTQKWNGGNEVAIALNECKQFAAQHVSSPSAPSFKVCGTGIKATIYLRNRCEAYYEHTQIIGGCDTGAPASTCDEKSPATDPRIGAYQSYKVEPC